MTPEFLEAGICGKTYKLSPITVGDLRAFETHIMNAKLARIREVSALMEVKDRAEILKNALKPITGTESQEMLASIDGMVFMIFRATRKNHPEMTLETLQDMLTLAAVKEVTPILMRLMFGDRDPQPPTTGNQ